MPALTIRTVVELEQKKLAFESSFNDSQKQMTSSVLSDGVVIFEQRKPVIKEMVADSKDGLEKFLNQAHQGLIAEMEFIFAASGKILQDPSPHICFLMGILFLSRGFYDDAIVHFQKAVDLEPGNVQAVKHYGVAMTLKGDFENARHILNYVLESGVAFADIYYCLGNTYLFQRQFNRAKPYYEEALKVNPNYADAHLRLATCAVGAIAGEDQGLVGAAVEKYAEEAQEKIQLALQCNSKIRTGALMAATDNLKQKKYPMALKNLLEARPKFNPKTGSEIVCFYVLKLLYGSKGVNIEETEEYLRQLEQLVEANPTYVDLRLHYGMANLIKSNFLINRSLREMNKALEINPNFDKAKATAGTLTDVYRKMLMTVKSVYNSGTR